MAWQRHLPEFGQRARSVHVRVHVPTRTVQMTKRAQCRWLNVVDGDGNDDDTFDVYAFPSPPPTLSLTRSVLVIYCILFIMNIILLIRCQVLVWSLKTKIKVLHHFSNHFLVWECLLQKSAFIWLKLMTKTVTVWGWSGGPRSRAGQMHKYLLRQEHYIGERTGIIQDTMTTF